MALSAASAAAVLLLASATTVAAQARPPGAELAPSTEPPCASLGCAIPELTADRPVERPVSALARPAEPHPFRALLEEVLFVGVGAAWYFLDPSNEFDWDRPPLRDRFTHAGVRFDNNTHPINFLWHPLSGAAYYAFPRNNGLSTGTSFVYGLGACLVWEYALEAREKVSINDIITTPITGLALGEFFSRLAFYLNRVPGGPTPRQRLIGQLLGPSQAIHDAMDRLPPVDANAIRDSLGYDASIAHRFETSLGVHTATGPAGTSLLTEFAIEGRLVAIEGFLDPGRSRGFFGDANATRLRLAFRGGHEAFGATIDADTIILGHRRSNVRLHPDGSRTGYAMLLGSSAAYYYRRDRMPGYEDRLGTTRFPGVAFDLDALSPRARWFVSVRGHADFAGVSPLAFDDWRRTHPDVRTKTALEREGYYYGWGWSTRLEARVETRYVAVRGSFDVAGYDSAEGWDRAQELVENDVKASDLVRDSAFAVRVTPWTRPRAFAELGYSGRYRHSVVGGFTREVRIMRAELRLGVSF